MMDAAPSPEERFAADGVREVQKRPDRINAEHGAAADTPQWVSAASLLERRFAPIRWIVREMLPQGYAVLAGAPKLGKSWLAYQLGVAVASGRPLWGNATDAGDVLNLAMEDGERRAQDRLRQVLGSHAAPARLHIATAWPRIGDGGLEQIEQWAKSVPAPRLVILDTFQRLRPPSRGNRNAYQEDYDLHGQVHALATRLGIAVLSVTHFRKGGSDDWVEAITGSMGISGAADTLLALKGGRGNPRATLHVTGRDVRELDLALERDGPQWKCLGDAAAHQMGETRKAIRDALASAGRPLAPKEVAEVAEVTHGLAKQTLRRMAEAGQVVADGGRYALPSL